ncbi:hypothetical protein D3C81_1545050 [compost metagenome]
MVTVYKRQFVFTTALLTDILSHFTVGQQHKVFDQLVGIFTYFGIYACRFAILIQGEFNLLTFKSNCTILKLTFTKDICQFIQF